MCISFVTVEFCVVVTVPNSTHINVALGDADLQVRREEGVVCCDAEEDKIYVVDPDGFEWETYKVTDASPDGLALLGTGNHCASAKRWPWHDREVVPRVA